MKVKIFICVLIFFNCCASKEAVQKNSQEEYSKDFINFKSYLKQVNFMNDFSDDITIREFDNSIILDFKKKYKINSIRIRPCKENTKPFGNHFKKCGNTIILYRSKVPYVQEESYIIFDYSKNGLKLNSNIPTNHKVVDRIFDF